MAILITGIAGFIGSEVGLKLLEQGHEIIGIDNINDYYDPSLKRARLSRFNEKKDFIFYEGDIAEEGPLVKSTFGRKISHVVHLAAQAGVRYSIQNPRAYIRSNIVGHLEVLEYCRTLDALEHLVYASSSSVYGGNVKTPFEESDPVNHPVSLYAATKRADELLSQTYAHLYGIPQTGLRFFTVYGPWGRPDMAYWVFTKAMLEGRPIRIFNRGEMWRDFTYIDDIVEGIVAVLETPPSSTDRHRVFNIGNSHPEHLGNFINLLEDMLKIKAIRQDDDMQLGDVERTFADITLLERETGFRPKVSLGTGLRKFTDWYRTYHHLS